MKSMLMIPVSSISIEKERNTLHFRKPRTPTCDVGHERLVLTRGGGGRKNMSRRNERDGAQAQTQALIPVLAVPSSSKAAPTASGNWISMVTAIGGKPIGNDKVEYMLKGQTMADHTAYLPTRLLSEHNRLVVTHQPRRAQD